MTRQHLIDLVMAHVQELSPRELEEFARDECTLGLIDYVYDVVTNLDEDRLKVIAEDYDLIPEEDNDNDDPPTTPTAA